MCNFVITASLKRKTGYPTTKSFTSKFYKEFIKYVGRRDAQWQYLNLIADIEIDLNYIIS